MATIRRGRGPSMTAEERDGKIVNKYRQPLIIELDSNDPDPISEAEVLALAGMPRPGYTMYSPRSGLVVPFAMCKSVAPKPRSKSHRIWDAIATYELSGSEQEDPEPDNTDPDNLEPKIEFFTSDTEVPLLKDFDDQVIADPFGDLYETPVMAPIALPGIRVTRYVASFDENTLAFWKHTTNDDTWRGEPAGTWCVTNVTGREVQFGEQVLGQLQFDIQANTLELPIEDKNSPGTMVTTRVGWMDSRILRASYFFDDAGKKKIEAVMGAVSTHFIDRFGKKTTGATVVDRARFIAYRNRRQRDFKQIIDYS